MPVEKSIFDCTAQSAARNCASMRSRACCSGFWFLFIAPSFALPASEE
jgi:hypothetical protein